MKKRFKGGLRPLPRDFLEWQVALRRFTMEERNGSPHAGVAPLLSVRSAGMGLGVGTCSIICGILPCESRLEQETLEFRSLYEDQIDAGARVVYDHGLAYLKDYYRDADDFDPGSLTTLLPKKGPVVDALRAEPRCSLVFYVFDLQDKSEIGRLRCLQLECVAEVLERGPVYDNVWWHNTLFHGPADEHVVIHFRHRETWSTVFGQRELVSA